MDIKEYIESGILEAYVLGALPQEEMAQVAADIARYPELAAEVYAIETTMQQFAATMVKEPPAALQNKIWDAIQAANPQSADESNAAAAQPARQIPLQPQPRMQWKYAAVWVALIGSLFLNLLLGYQSKKESTAAAALASARDTLNARMESMEQEQAKLAALMGEYQKGNSMMADTAMKTIVMTTMQKGHPMAATLYWSKASGASYVAINALPPAPRGMQYQLWVLQGGKPMSMGVIANNMASTPILQKVEVPVTAGDAFAISLEKEGGSPSPTMERIYVLGKA